jgi:hypothetical protein
MTTPATPTTAVTLGWLEGQVRKAADANEDLDEVAVASEFVRLLDDRAIRLAAQAHFKTVVWLHRQAKRREIERARSSTTPAGRRRTPPPPSRTLRGTRLRSR